MSSWSFAHWSGSEVLCFSGSGVWRGWAELNPAYNESLGAHSTLSRQRKFARLSEVLLAIRIVCWAGTGRAGWSQLGETSKNETPAGKWGAAEPHAPMFWMDMCIPLSLGCSPCGLLPLQTAFHGCNWYTIFYWKRKLVRVIKRFFQRQPATSWNDKLYSCNWAVLWAPSLQKKPQHKPGASVWREHSTWRFKELSQIYKEVEWKILMHV